MARRGFLAALQHAARVAARENERARKTAVRAHLAAVRQAEQARRTSERAHAQLVQASAAERKRLEKEAREAHIRAMEAEAAEKTLELEQVYEEIDSLLAATLDVDDYVDLETLRVVVAHPPFDHPELERPLVPPSSPSEPPAPQCAPPEAPTGIAALFGKKRHAAALVRAREDHEKALAAWRVAVEQAAARHQADVAAHRRVEEERVERLATERGRYAEQCAAREAEASLRNRELDELIANLGYGVVEAVQEYVSIVLANSVYPEHFPVKHEFSFDPASAELTLRVQVPPPEQLPTTKAYKFAKASGVAAVPLPEKACRDRYASAVHQVALRSLHEVFEADRRALIRTVSLEVGTTALDTATGRRSYVPFVAVGVAREVFVEFDLASVVPSRTLERLGAALSKDPYRLYGAEITGARKS